MKKNFFFFFFFFYFKRTLCGTPNYIAPEVLNKKGHSYEVDVWSLGCILYTLLIGKPPFETSCLKDTYAKIKKNEYSIPPNKVSLQAKNLINHLLQSDPSLRPTMAQILQDEFFYSGYLPPRLPTTCLSMPPRFDRDVPNTTINSMNTPNQGGLGQPSRKPLLEINDGKSTQLGGGDANGLPNPRVATGVDPRAPSGLINQQTSSGTSNIQRTNTRAGDNIEPSTERQDDAPEDYFLGDLYQQLNQVILSKPTEIDPLKVDDAEDPACVPMLWISKWVDYSDKYGLGYQLCDDSVGVLFNDSTRLILCSIGE